METFFLPNNLAACAQDWNEGDEASDDGLPFFIQQILPNIRDTSVGNAMAHFFCSRFTPGPSCLYIKTCYHQWHTIDDAPFTINGLRRVVAKCTSTPTNKVKLFFQGNILMDGNTVADYNIGNGSVVMQLFYRKGKARQLNLKGKAHKYFYEGKKDCFKGRPKFTYTLIQKPGCCDVWTIE